MWSLPEDEEDENTMKKRTFLAKVMTLYAKYVRFACVARAFCMHCTCILHALHVHFACSVLACVVRTLYMVFVLFYREKMLLWILFSQELDLKSFGKRPKYL